MTGAGVLAEAGLMKWQAVLPFFLLCACDTAPSASEPVLTTKAEHPAIAAFWDAFHASDYAALDGVIEDISRARAVTPDDPDLEFFSAHAHLWRLAEWSRAPERPEASQIAALREAVSGFRQAAQLRPDDARVPCWLGLLELQTGRQFADPELMAQGIANLEYTTAAFPEFGHFCEILAYWDQPRESEEFAKAVEAGWKSIDVCLEAPIDRADPDVGPYLDQATLQGPRSVCWNGGAAPHNEEGYWLVMGDLFTRAGEAALARRMYKNAQARDSYLSWQFKGLLEDRLQRLDERMAAFTDTDAANDPELLPSNAGCVLCHAR